MLTDPTDADVMPLSFSKLTTFQQCPLKFKFRYIDKLEEEEGVALLEGVAVHKALEEHLKGKRAWQDVVAEYAGTYGLNPVNLVELTKSGLDMIAEQQREHNIRIEFSELRFAVKEENNKATITTFSDKDALFRGIIDIVAVRPMDQTYYVVDFKTGRWRSDALQLMLYCAAMRYAGFECEGGAFFYLRRQKADWYTFEEEQLELAVQSIKEAARKIKEHVETGEFPARVGTYCSYCQFKMRCPVFADTSAPDSTDPEKLLAKAIEHRKLAEMLFKQVREIIETTGQELQTEYLNKKYAYGYKEYNVLRIKDKNMAYSATAVLLENIRQSHGWEGMLYMLPSKVLSGIINALHERGYDIPGVEKKAQRRIVLQESVESAEGGE